MKVLKRVLTILAIFAAVLLAVFLGGRYGWKLGGFNACESAGIELVEVREDAVRIKGFYPGSFPEGFCGCYAREQEGTLYVGFRFSAVFGMFESGDFDITIPVKSPIHRVILKTSMMETSIWNRVTGAISQSERYGVYVKLEGNQVYSVSLSCAGIGGEDSGAAYTALDSGEYCFLENDVMIASKEAEAPVPFTITVKNADGTVAASETFSFDANAEKMYLTVTRDGRIVEDTIHE